MLYAFNFMSETETLALTPRKVFQRHCCSQRSTNTGIPRRPELILLWTADLTQQLTCSIKHSAILLHLQSDAAGYGCHPHLLLRKRRLAKQGKCWRSQTQQGSEWGFRHPPLHHRCTLGSGKGEAGGGRRLWRAVRWIPTEGVYVKCRVSVMGGSSQEPGGLSLCGSWKRLSSKQSNQGILHPRYNCGSSERPALSLLSTGWQGQPQLWCLSKKSLRC